MKIHPNKIKSIHPFPARMAPIIALKSLPPKKRKSLKILDPMMGSGTSLVVARSLGHEAFGFDIDPLAVTISSSWVVDFSSKDVEKIAENITSKATKIARRITQKKAYPIGADDRTKKFIRYWFDVENRKQLRGLSEVISEIVSLNVRNIMWSAFSRLIIAKERGASLAMDLSHSRPHKVLERASIKPLDHFENSVKTIISRAIFANTKKLNLPKATVKVGDSRKIPLLSNSIDYVITSPPYLNAIDYIRCSKFSLVWMGYSIDKLRDIRSQSIGSETLMKKTIDYLEIVGSKMGRLDLLPERNKKMLWRYLNDLDAILNESSRVMKINAKAIFIVGDSNIKDVFIKNSYAVKKIGERYGLVTIASRKRPIKDSRRYLPPPSIKKSGDSFRSRMREEVIITMQKKRAYLAPAQLSS